MGDEPGSVIEDLGGLLDAVPDAVLALAHDGEVLFANAAARELFADLSSKFEIPPVGLGQPEVTEIAVERAGTTRLTEMRQSRATWRGEQVHLVILRDVTEQRQLQARVQQNERLALIGRIAAEVAHEINNPAAFIQVNLELLREEVERSSSSDRGPLHELVHDSLAGVQRIARIVDDLRRFSRAPADEVEEVDLPSLVRDACRMLVTKIRSGAEVELDLQPVPSRAGRPGRLLQVVTNLVVNALQAVETRPVAEARVRVSTRAAGDDVLLVVEDNGVGMAPETRRRAFDPFFTTKSPARGTGLGLAMCAEIVGSHRGTIAIDSEEGSGTRVEVRIPRDTGLVANREPVANHPVRAPEPGRPRVLIIDDEPSIRASLRRALERQFEVQTAEDGDAGRAAIDRDPPFDVIVCDLIMPGLDGPGLYEHVRRTRPELCARFLFASGGSVTEREREFVTREGIRLLHKPFSLREFREAVTAMAVVSRASTPSRPTIRVVGSDT